VAKAQDGALVGQAAHAGVQLGELAVQRHIVQALFHGQIAQAEPLLHAVNAQLGLRGKGRPTCLARRGVRLDQAQEFSPRHHQIHLIEQVAPALGDQLTNSLGQACLSHHR
jgi:hypothetical protein